MDDRDEGKATQFALCYQHDSINVLKQPHNHIPIHTHTYTLRGDVSNGVQQYPTKNYTCDLLDLGSFLLSAQKGMFIGNEWPHDKHGLQG